MIDNGYYFYDVLQNKHVWDYENCYNYYDSFGVSAVRASFCFSWSLVIFLDLSYLSLLLRYCTYD